MCLDMWLDRPELGLSAGAGVEFRVGMGPVDPAADGGPPGRPVAPSVDCETGQLSDFRAARWRLGRRRRTQSGHRPHVVAAADCACAVQFAPPATRFGRPSGGLQTANNLRSDDNNNNSNSNSNDHDGHGRRLCVHSPNWLMSFSRPNSPQLSSGAQRAAPSELCLSSVRVPQVSSFGGRISSFRRASWPEKVCHSSL